MAIFRPLLLLAVIVAAQATEKTGNNLSYDHFLHSNEPIKCMYGYAASKTGDHVAALTIFEDCAERFNSVYAMIWLAQIYETGVAVEQDFAKATAYLKRGAHTTGDAYASLAQYHYGVALLEGRGTAKNNELATHYLRLAAHDGVEDAVSLLKTLEQ